MTTLAALAPREVRDPGPSPTGLIRRCCELMFKPLDQFTVEDLRIMLGQAICVRHLLPLAIPALLQEPLAEAEFYPGDLLVAVLRLPVAAWDTLPEQRRELTARLRDVTADDHHVAQTIAAFLLSS